jgi:hypothetical protein
MLNGNKRAGRDKFEVLPQRSIAIRVRCSPKPKWDRLLPLKTLIGQPLLQDSKNLKFLIWYSGREVESNWVHSTLRPLIGLLYQPRVIKVIEKLVKWWLAGENEVLGENLSQCDFVQHKSHMLCPDANRGRRGGNPAANRLSYGTALYDSKLLPLAVDKRKKCSILPLTYLRAFSTPRTRYWNLSVHLFIPAYVTIRELLNRFVWNL